MESEVETRSRPEVNDIDWATERNMVRESAVLAE